MSDAAIRAALSEVGVDAPTHFTSRPVDLNGDGVEEVVAYLSGPALCGSGGCNLVVLARAGDRFRLVARTSVTRLPVRLLRSSTSGWRDLSVAVAGGGTQPRQVRLRFDGRSYPANPTVLPDAERVETDAGDLLIAEPTRSPD